MKIEHGLATGVWGFHTAVATRRKAAVFADLCAPGRVEQLWHGKARKILGNFSVSSNLSVVPSTRTEIQ